MKKLAIPIIDIKKYGGRQVAVVNGSIVASGDTADEVIKAVKRKFPNATWRDVLLVSVPEGLTIVYRIWADSYSHNLSENLKGRVRRMGLKTMSSCQNSLCPSLRAPQGRGNLVL